MKYTYIVGIGLICLLSLKIYSFENRLSNKPTLKLTGQIESCEVLDEGDRIKLSFKLILSVKNTGSIPILLLSEKQTLIRREIISAENGSQKTLFSLWTRPSIGINDEWLKLSKDINKASPPIGQIERIKAGDVIKMETADWFYINKNKASTWKELMESNHLLLRLTYETWSLNIEPRQSTLDKKKFGQELRERWKTDGYLWTDEITSEPLELNLQICK